jgi:adenylate kinase
VKNIVIIGPPGSGKDTQIEKMRELFDFEVISTGDIARALAVKNEKCRLIIESGGLIDDNILTKELGEKLDNIEKSKSVVFDGYPRTLHQADLLDEILLHHGRVLDHVIYLTLDEAVVVNRLSVRKVCSICGHNVKSDEKKCSFCGGETVRRHDDSPAIIIHRVQTFLENTLPLANYYQNRGILLEINGDQSIDAVAHEIAERLGYDGK